MTETEVGAFRALLSFNLKDLFLCASSQIALFLLLFLSGNLGKAEVKKWMIVCMVIRSQYQIDGVSHVSTVEA